MERSLHPAVLDEIAERFTGGPIAPVPKSRLPTGSVGAVTKTGRGSLQDARVLEALAAEQFQRAAQHESGHILDYAAGEIPADGLVRQLRELYDFGGSPSANARKPIDPSFFGYKKPEFREEYWAEALRQYMVAPDTMKAKYPEIAARIREYVNSNPKIMDLLQFNSLAAPAGGVAAGFLYGADPSAEADARAWLGGI